MEEENKENNPEEDITNPHRRKLGYSENYRRKYEEKYGKKQKVNENPIKQPPEQNWLITDIEKAEKAVEKEAVKIEKEIIREASEFKANKFWIITGVIVIITLIFAGIYFFTTPSIKTKYTPLDAIPLNNSGMPSTIYYDGKNLLGITGFESSLQYAEKYDRLFGNEQYKKIVFDDKGKAYTVISLDNEIRLEPLASNPNQVTRIGWFTDVLGINVTEIKKFSTKQVSSKLTGINEIKSAGFEYSLFKNKPYMKIQFSADAENSSLLGNFAYGLVFSGYDIYLQNSTILKNDNERTNLNKTVETVLYQGSNKTTNISLTLTNEISKTVDPNKQAVSRKGSSYQINNSDYQIFYSQNKSQAIIVYSPKTIYFENLFLWNVYRIYVPYNDGYSPLYITVLDNVKLTYDETAGDWRIQNSKINEYASFYISDIVNEIEK